MKKTNSKNKLEFEIRVLPDRISEEYCIKCVNSEKSSYKIILSTLESIWKDSSKIDKKPLLILGIRRSEKEIFLLQCKINLERKK